MKIRLVKRKVFIGGNRSLIAKVKYLKMLKTNKGPAAYQEGQLIATPKFCPFADSRSPSGLYVHTFFYLGFLVITILTDLLIFFTFSQSKSWIDGACHMSRVTSFSRTEDNYNLLK